MKWDHLSEGVWTIPTAAREKGHAGELRLPGLALVAIEAQPRLASNPYVFAAARGGGHFAGFSKAKAALDTRLPPMPQWQLHDLRRTARSCLSCCGVRPDISERVLGHVQPGITAVYGRHTYLQEKNEALERLARLIESIVGDEGGGGNVVSLEPRRSRR